MDFKILKACLFSCLALAAVGCNESDSTNYRQCEGNKTVCISNTQYRSCVDGLELTRTCPKNQECQEINGVVGCSGTALKLCGNGIVDAGEECDGNQFFGKTCGSYIIGGTGTLSCTDACKINISGCSAPEAYCGNSVIEAGEQCDLNNLNGKTCSDVLRGYDGELKCNDECQFVMTNCKRSTPIPVCGNGVVENGEQCDVGNLNGKSCGEIVPGTVGTLSCNESCQFVTTNCQVGTKNNCGNGVVDADEQCDGSDLNGKKCGDIIEGTIGSLYCTNRCVFNTNYCYEGEEEKPVDAKCGNNRIDQGEDCDGPNLNGMLCSDLGNFVGELSCDDECHFITKGCTSIVDGPVCGDGIVGAGEQCDGTNLNEQTCGTIVPGTTGTLWCDNCRFVTANCKVPVVEPVCGNGVLEDGEQCDRHAMLDVKCSDVIPNTIGELKCDSKCRFDSSKCVEDTSIKTCGNGVIDEGEQCDSSNMDGKTCADVLSGSMGYLSCNNKCKFDTTRCVLNSPPPLNSPCDDSFTACYDGDLYYCVEGKVQEYLCETSYDDVSCMLLPDGKYECVDTDMDGFCLYDGQAVLYSDPLGCEYYEDDGTIYYERCVWMNGKFYGIPHSAGSICYFDEVGSYVVECEDRTSYYYEVCDGECRFMPETDVYYGYAICGDEIPNVDPKEGAPCKENYEFVCVGNTVLVCYNNIWMAYRECTGNTECDTITNEEGSVVNADCTTECTEDEAGYIVAYSSTCNTDKFGDYFELYGCLMGDSGEYRIFGGDYASSFCYEDNIQLACNSKKEVTFVDCPKCTDNFNEDKYIFEATCH